MPTTQRNFNGTTFALGNTSQGKIISMQITIGGAKIDVYEPGDLVRLMELGIPTQAITIGLRGTDSQPVQGAKGSPVITLGSGSALTVANTSWMCMGTNLSGREDGAWEGSAEYSPTVT
jgi:hypothetical protein